MTAIFSPYINNETREALTTLVGAGLRGAAASVFGCVDILVSSTTSPTQIFGSRNVTNHRADGPAPFGSFLTLYGAQPDNVTVIRARLYDIVPAYESMCHVVIPSIKPFSEHPAASLEHIERQIADASKPAWKESRAGVTAAPAKISPPKSFEPREPAAELVAALPAFFGATPDTVMLKGSDIDIRFKRDAAPSSEKLDLIGLYEIEKHGRFGNCRIHETPEAMVIRVDHAYLGALTVNPGHGCIIRKPQPFAPVS